MMGGWTDGGGPGLGWLYAPRTRDRRVCILRPSGGSTLAADFLLELRAPISGGGEEAQPPDRVPRQTMKRGVCESPDVGRRRGGDRVRPQIRAGGGARETRHRRR